MTDNTQTAPTSRGQAVPPWTTVTRVCPECAWHHYKRIVPHWLLPNYTKGQCDVCGVERIVASAVMYVEVAN